MAEVWTGSKRQREALRTKYDGRCAYCGEELTKMQADHLEPVTRITTDPWGKPLSAQDRRVMRPDRNVVANMMPACPQCNNSKGGYTLEGWRDLLSRSAEIVAREKPIFKAGVRFGRISISDGPIVFHFERVASEGADHG